MFETEEQEQVRMRLADTLRWVVSQRLVQKFGGSGRYALLEIMGSNLRVQEVIRQGESDARNTTLSNQPTIRLADLRLFGGEPRKARSPKRPSAPLHQAWSRHAQWFDQEGAQRRPT